jgi:hypothetical protein
MSLLNNGLRGNVVAGLAIGIGALLVVPVAFRVLSGVFRPVAEGAVKGGAYLYEKGMEMATGTWESMSRMMSEVQSELSARKAPAAATAVALQAEAAAPAPKRARAKTRAPRAAADKTAAGKKPARKPARKPEKMPETPEA